MAELFDRRPRDISLDAIEEIRLMTGRAGQTEQRSCSLHAIGDNIFAAPIRPAAPDGPMAKPSLAFDTLDDRWRPRPLPRRSPWRPALVVAAMIAVAWLAGVLIT